MAPDTNSSERRRRWLAR